MAMARKQDFDILIDFYKPIRRGNLTFEFDYFFRNLLLIRNLIIFRNLTFKTLVGGLLPAKHNCIIII